jgi:3-hydroxyisobutyrate dehydrogenase
MIGFVGLGRMGRGMASNLFRRSGEEVMVFDTSPEAVDALVSIGAIAASSIEELTRSSTVVFTSLPGPPQVEEVVFGSGGILDNLQPDFVLFDLSTNSLSLQRRIYDAFALRGAAMLDAPVSGGPAGATSGDLAIWVGGARELYDRHLPLLGSIGDKPRYVGGLGAGTVTKLSHNMLGYMIMLSMAEVFSMAVKAGVDPLDLWESIRMGVVGKQSPLDMLTKQFLPGLYETPAMALRLGHKDMTLGTMLGHELGVAMRMADLTHAEMTEALARGFGDQDSRAYLKLQLERADVEIAVDPDRLSAAIEAIRPQS